MNEQHIGMVASLDEARKRRAAESIVICLECAAAYEKPGAAGTLARSPGCPACGYVGWIGVMRVGGRLARVWPPGAAAAQTETRASSSIEV